MTQPTPIRPPERFQVKAGIADGEPFIELNDNLAVQQITLDLEDALLIAANINGAVVQMLGLMKQQAHAKRRGLVTANGAPI